ncbi:hypothetical protein P389DRAFT_52084 [Cystobasidium minutum MCA 4210]|uniref:uncharacterized protein n=1 Tax=Cystobasidium minutum MCA 4210 TaxID=1397322 RepID=UPI0034CD5A1E|eukprot:jgi/Rhomi1/52084/CE52083_303
MKAKRRKSEADSSATTATGTSSTKKRKVDSKSKSASTAVSAAASAASHLDSFRVEHLSYKRLLPGPTVLLVQIIAILPLELIVSLPEQLLGHIPITDISSIFTKRLEEDVEASDDEDDEEESDEEDGDAGSNAGEGSSSDKIPNLTQMFNVGQYLRASVVNVVSGKNASAQLSSTYGAGSKRGNEEWKSSRRCELTLEPSKVNAGVTFNDLKSSNGSTLQATIKSVEDTGYILDFGINTNTDQSDKSTLTSFIPFKAIKPLRKSGDLPPQALTSGGIITARISKISENGRTCTVSVSPNEIKAAVLTESSVGLSALIPGSLVQGAITAITPSGLNVKFLGFYEGSIDNLHMLPPASGHTYKVGEKIKARILWTAPPLNDSPVRFSLSTLPHILSLTPKVAPLNPGVPNSEVAPISQVLPIGTFLENLQIIKVEPEWGLLCVVPGTDLKAFVHISHVSDEHITNLTTHATSGLWKVGSTHKGRVIGYSALDGLLQATLQKSVIERRFMKVQDLQVGERIDGTVQRLSDSALFVNIHGNVAGVVWPLHYSDLKLKHPERRFKAGTAVKARILSLDPEKNRVVLTLKRSLVNSDLPVISTVEEAKPGLVIHAMVQTFINKDMLVETFGGMRAFVPVAEAADHFVENIQKEFNLGQVVKVKLIHVDTEARRLTASVKQALDTYKAPSDTKGKKKENAPAQESEYTFSDNVSAVDIGDKVTGEITAIHESQIVLQLKGSLIKALLSISALAKMRNTSALELKPTLAVGQTISDLAVVSKNLEKGLVIVGLSQPKAGPSLIIGERGGISQSTEQPLITFDSLQEGNILEATIGDQIPVGYFVQISRGIRGKMRWTEISDDYDNVKALELTKGSKVKCIIVDYDKDEKRIDLSMRRSRLEGDVTEDEVRDPVLDNIKSLKKDQPVRGFVRNITDNGVFVDIGVNLTARVQIKELFDEYVKDWKPRFTIGQVVDGKILSTAPAKNQIEMTLRKTSSSKKAAKEKEPSITFEGLSVGETVKGVIKRLEAYGAFIRIEGSTVSGLCHKSKIVDENPSKWNEGLSVGDKVRAKIIELDVEKHKIAFSMKPSDLPEEESEDEDEEENSVMQKLNHLVELQEAASDEDDDEEDDSDDDIRIMMQGLEESDDDDDEEEDDDDEDEDEDEGVSMQEDQPEASTSQSAAPLKLSAFKWDGVVDTPAEADEDEISEDDEEEEAPSKRKAKGILVDDKTGDLASQLPTSPSDFDRLLLASPNSSLLWIQYMSYYLQLGDIEQARSISQRALKTINYREEEERLNIWIASLNLESMHGTDDSFDEMFNKAIQTNDAKQVFLRTTEALEASQKLDKAEEIYQRFVKKFNMSSKAWTLFGTFLLRNGKADQARDLLPRSLKSLPKRKHVKTISQFGLMEFKIGEPERGRTIFEGIIDSYPKRLDLWWIYIDQEIRLKNVLGVRALFDRVLMTKLSSKKTKSVFKKWLAFEKQHGDEVAAEAVKERAIEYVQSLQKDDEDDE